MLFAQCSRNLFWSLETANLVWNNSTPFFWVIFILPNKVSVWWQPLPELFLGLSSSDWLDFNFTDCGRFLRNAWKLVWSLETKNLVWNNSAPFLVILILPNKVSVWWQPLPKLFLGLSLSDGLDFNFTDCGRFLRNALEIYFGVLKLLTWCETIPPLFF